MSRTLKTVGVLGLVTGLLAIGALEGWAALLGLDRPAGVALSILLAAATLWVAEAVPLFVTSLFILFANVVWMTPVLTDAGRSLPSSAFMAPFFSDVILLFLGGFVLSSAFQRYGIDERVAQAVLRRTGRRPSMVLAGVMLTTAILSMWMSNTATTAMMLGLSAPLLAKVANDEPFRRAVLLGIPFAANLGGIGTPIGTPPNAIAMQSMTEQGHAISFATWMLMALPMLVILLVVAWLLILRLYPPRMTELAPPAASEIKGSTKGHIVVAVAGLTIAGWLTGTWHGLSSGVVALLPLLVFFGGPILDPQDFRKLPWDVLILAGGGLSLGVAVAESGLARRAVDLVPVNEAPTLLIAAGFAAVASLMSTFMSNTATANLLIPVAMGLPLALQQPILCVVAFSCSVSMALPVTTPPNAMAFGSGSLQVKDMVVPGTILSVMGVTLAVLSTLWWRLLGVF